ncbi:hypothetical protein ASC75_01875 [Aminobacter sp. DSM 101952]|nr:hypothetical protein [Aminobacter sp. DSM 101952]KQU76395.1 hypothetical protein ASC75_01875 [Aminobacter sp. DSM 101952]
MGEETRIWDHEIADFGRRSIPFLSSNGPYSIEVDQANQDEIHVLFEGQRLVWHVFCKSVRDGLFRLQGMTGGAGDPYKDGGDWFELVLSSPAVLRYWGDRVLVHEDHEMLA